MEKFLVNLFCILGVNIGCFFFSLYMSGFLGMKEYGVIIAVGMYICTLIVFCTRMILKRIDRANQESAPKSDKKDYYTHL